MPLKDDTVHPANATTCLLLVVHTALAVQTSRWCKLVERQLKLTDGRKSTGIRAIH